jgi:hypothetical protein
MGERDSVRKEAGSSFWELEVQPPQQSETQQAVEN